VRILHLDSGREMRGGQWQALRLAQGLTTRGHNCSLAAPAGSPLLARARESGIAACPIEVLRLRQWARASDVVHAHDARSHTLAAIARLRPLVVSRRVAFPISGGLLSRWKYGQTDRYIAISEHVKKVLVDGGVPPARISVIPDGVPLLPPASERNRIIAPASRDPLKGTALALEAARLAGVDLELSGNLEHDLSQSRLFVYITESEGLGSAVLLAMSAGVPVIVSKVGGLTEIVEDGETGLVVANTAPAIASAIRRLIQDASLAERLGGRGRQTVAQKFTVDALVDRTLHLYQEVLVC